MLGEMVTVVVDRPLGSVHPRHPHIRYPLNYGFVPGVPGGDGEEQDAYIVGVDVPLRRFRGRVVAVVRRLDDVEDKWVVAPPAARPTRAAIARAVRFQERYFTTQIDYWQGIISPSYTERIQLLTYDQSLEFIHGIARFGSKPGLRRVRLLLERMGNPQNGLRFLHVAGTDGKGSTCTMLSHIYTGAGYRTGLYISPFVVDFRERIQLDNAMIPPEELARSTSTVKAHWDALDAAGETPTEFEVVVAVAIDYFARMRCDLVIFEVGLGGRHDATNVIPAPLCAVITHISLDHMEYLGDTIEQIAAEKCGIIKPGSAVVSYPAQDPAALAVIRDACARTGSPLTVAGEAQVLAADIHGSELRYAGQGYRVPLAGLHQVRNAVTAIEAVKALRLSGFAVSDAQAAAGIAAARFPARVEVLAREPLVLLDGGHNPAEAAALADTLRLLGGRRIHAAVGMLADKDVEACLAAVLPLCCSLTALTPAYPRALSAPELADIARRYCADVRVQAGDDLAGALRAAYRRCGAGDVLLCCGSLYLSAQMRPLLLELVEKR